MELSVNAKRSRSVSHNRALRSEIYAVHLLSIIYLDLENQEDDCTENVSHKPHQSRELNQHDMLPQETCSGNAGEAKVGAFMSHLRWPVFFVWINEICFV
ncbi:hypothetical protein T10_7003 [Trichinella papuae]|uniref:Uncharacterized protein n=1 Tax=Trichinella papuae TaxID=268474 RepID=A0A0V1N1L4_9BILA|nr:hypothetical protein T10_7003 [Trichinella papuae]